MKSTKTKSVLIGLWVVSLIGCGGGSSSTTTPSDDTKTGESANPLEIGGDGNLYAPDRLVQVSINMNPDDFERLKAEGRSLASTAQACVPEYEYTEFVASVTIDGDTLPDVVIRKKGFLGSLSPSRPSLKLDFDDLVEDRTYQQMSRMTLNNNRQDVSNARQCMAYDKFREVGIAAPLCNLAQVTVNGEDLGVFTNVEPIKKPFLKRVFDDKSGNLYEAQLSDFGQYLGDTFEKKTNEKENDRSDLQAVADALALPDDELVNALPQVVAVDEFIRFWAMETLLGFWDSATGNANNFYIYRLPEDGLFHFIPWGADTAFTGIHLLNPDSGALYRNFNLADRLWKIEAYRTQYLTTLQQFMDEHWDEATLAAEVNRIQALTGTSDTALETLRTFISGKGTQGEEGHTPSQRQRLLDAMANPEGQAHLLTDQPKNCDSLLPTTSLSASVSANNGADNGTFQFTLPDGQVVNASLTLAAFQVDSLLVALTEFTQPSVVSLQLIGADTNNSFKPYVLQVYVEVSDYQAGAHEFHGLATNVVLLEVDGSEPMGVKTLAFGESGTLHLSNLSPLDNGSNNAPNVTLSLEATLAYLNQENQP